MVDRRRHQNPIERHVIWFASLHKLRYGNMAESSSSLTVSIDERFTL